MKPTEIIENLIGQSKTLHSTLVSLRNEHGNIHELDRDSIRQQLRNLYALTGQLAPDQMVSGLQNTEIRQHQPEDSGFHVEIKEENSGLDTAIKAVLEDAGRTTETVSETAVTIEPELTSPSPATWPDEPAIHAGIEKSVRSEQVIAVPTAPHDSTTHEGDSGRSLADRFSPSETVGDHIQRNQPVKRVADKLRSSPLSDLHESIGINERFAFINHLFKGDQARYFDAINRLNASHSQEDALHYLNQELLPGMAWKNPPSAWKDFIELVSRRYQA